MSLAHLSQHWFDGKPLTDSLISLTVDSPLIHAGEGWFETLRIETGVPLRYDAHLDRLCRAWAASGLFGQSAHLPEDLRREDLRREWLQTRIEPALHEAHRYATGRLRISLIPPAASQRRTDLATQTAAPESAHVLVALSSYQPPVQAYRYGVSAITSRRPHPRMGELGKSLSYHWSTSAQREAEAQGGDIALFAAGVAAAGIHSEAGWLEASSASLLWPCDQGWCTTSGVGGALASVTVQGLRETGLVVQTQSAALPRDIFENGLLLVSALRLVVAVHSIDGRALPDLTATAAALRARLLTTGG